MLIVPYVALVNCPAKKRYPNILKFISTDHVTNPLWAAVGNVDTSGISMLQEVKKNIDRRGLKVEVELACSRTSLIAFHKSL